MTRQPKLSRLEQLDSTHQQHRAHQGNETDARPERSVVPLRTSYRDSMAVPVTNHQRAGLECLPNRVQTHRTKH
jgi:hypothetical protein